MSRRAPTSTRAARRAGGRTLVLAVLAAWLGAAGVAAQSSGDTSFERAVTEYRDGHYALATELFSVLAGAEEDPGRRAMLHYDAGTAAARDDRLGLAVWHLERARHLDPGLDGVATNLDMVRARLGEGVLREPGFAESIVRLPLLWTGHAVETGVSVGLALGLLLVAAWRARLVGHRWAVVGLVVIVLGACALVWADVVRARDGRRGVIVHDEGVMLRGEPASSGPPLVRVGAGALVKPGRTVEGWRHVDIGETEGWVPEDVVRPIAP